MRLKTFHADNLSTALELVRQTLGPSAIIVATHEDDANRGARVTAAIEPEDQGFDFFNEGASDQTLERLTNALESHGVPNTLTDRIVEAASAVSEGDPAEVLSQALEEVFTFSPLPDRYTEAPLMLIGPPGTGKTVTCAKLAARAVLSAQGTAGPGDVMMIAADTVRLGAVDQLRIYADKLGVSLAVAKDSAELSLLLGQARRRSTTLIDTAGTNPFDLSELAHLIELSDSAKPHSILVLSAGRDPDEAAEIASAFRPLGATRLISTGLDIARRLGSILSAAEAGGLALSEISTAPEIGEGLKPLTPDGLASLILPGRKPNGSTSHDDGVRAP